MTARGDRLYRRLPGVKRTPVGLYDLWLAEDHILLVQVRGFKEIYRRFYFRDIQALIVRRTARREHRALALAILATISLAFAYNSGPWWMFWGPLAGLCLAALVLDLALGPSCATTLRTALQTVDLPPLHRLRKARAVIRDLRMHLELDQGTLAREDLLARIRDEAAAGAAATEPAVGDVAPPAPPPIAAAAAPSRHEDGRAHEILAYILLLSAVAGVVPVFYFHVAVNAVLSLIFLARMGFVVAALARQRRTDLPPPVKGFAWTALAFEGANASIGIVAGMVLFFRTLTSGAQPNAAQGPPNIASVADLLIQSPAYKGWAIVMSLLWLALGAWGLFLLRRAAPAERTPWPALPS